MPIIIIKPQRPFDQHVATQLVSLRDQCARRSPAVSPWTREGGHRPIATMHEFAPDDLVAQQGIVRTPAIREAQRRGVSIESLVLPGETHELPQVVSLTRHPARAAVRCDHRHASLERGHEARRRRDGPIELREHVLPASVAEQRQSEVGECFVRWHALRIGRIEAVGNGQPLAEDGPRVHAALNLVDRVGAIGMNGCTESDLGIARSKARDILVGDIEMGGRVSRAPITHVHAIERQHDHCIELRRTGHRVDEGALQCLFRGNVVVGRRNSQLAPQDPEGEAATSPLRDLAMAGEQRGRVDVTVEDQGGVRDWGLGVWGTTKYRNSRSFCRMATLAESSSPTAPSHGRVAPPRAAWAALAVLTLINLFNYIDRFVVPAVVESIKHSSLQPSDAQIGLLATAFLWVYMVAAPFFGYYGSRPWRLRLVAVGVAVWSLATAAAGLATTFGSLLGARAIVGIGEAAYSAIAPAVLADYFPERLRGRVFGVFYAAIPVGAALGFLIGGYVDHAAGWRAAFFVVGLPGLVAALLTLTLPNPAPGAHDTAVSPASAESLEPPPTVTRLFAHLPEGVAHRLRTALGPYLPLLGNAQYQIVVLGYAAYTFAFGGISFWMVSFLVRVRGLDAVAANQWLGMIVVVTGFVGTFLGGVVGDALEKRVRRGYLWLSAVSVLVATPAVYLALTAPSPAVFWPALAIADLLLFLSTSPINAVIVADVPPTIRAAAMAASILVIHALGDGVSPAIIGRLSDRATLGQAVLIIPVAVLVSGAIWMWAAIRRQPARPTPSSPQESRSP
jgi:MFS transporter, Spinster family, sphingosine-1-phosphate transporter